MTDKSIGIGEFVPRDWNPLSRLADEHPDVPIIVCHAGHLAGGYHDGDLVLRQALKVTAGAWRNGKNNVYLETETWPAKYFRVALDDPNVGITQLIWGGDYGSRRYIVAPRDLDQTKFAAFMRKWQLVARYQVDWWGTAFHCIDQIQDFVTQEEINLIMRGNAARVFDFPLPMPYHRMFMIGRPDHWGAYWEDSMADSN